MTDPFLPRLLTDIMENAIELEILRQNGQHVTPHAMNASYDTLLNNIMELFRETQEHLREYNSNVRMQIHQARLERRRQQRLEETVAIVVENEIRPEPRIPKPKSKVLKKTELTRLMENDCGICLDKTTRIHTVDTCCGHTFCKTCFDSYRISVMARPEDRIVKCPMCRKVNPKITEFRERKAPTKKPVIQEEVDELTDLVNGIQI